MAVPSVSIPRLDPTARVDRHPAVWVGLGALLLGEVLALTFRFDTQALVDRGGWWGSLLALARYLPQGVIALGAAAVVFGGPRIRRRASASVADERRVSAWTPRWRYLLAHLAVFGLFSALTAEVWEGPLGRSTWAPAWGLAWLVTGTIVVALLAVSAQPLGAWRDLVRRGWNSGALAAAIAVGAGAALAGNLAGNLWLWKPLGQATLWSARGVLGLCFQEVVFVPAESVVGTPSFHVEVAASCSGYEGIGLIWAFLAVYLWFFRRELRFPRALWLVPIGTLVMWLANVARIAALVVIGSRFSPEVALGGFHSQAGWLAFNLVALGLVLTSRNWRVFRMDPAPAAGAATVDEIYPSAGSARAVDPATAHLAPLLALVATIMVTSALTPAGGFDVLYPLRVVAVAMAVWGCRRGYRASAWTWSWSPLALGVVAFSAWLALEWNEAPGRSAAAEATRAGFAGLPGIAAWIWLGFRVLGSVVAVPLAEELAFRGYLTRRLIAADFDSVPLGHLTWTSFLGSSLLFGALHGRWLAGTIAGMVYALALRQRGRLGDAIVAHAVTNASIAALVIGRGSWTLWV